MKVVLQRVNEAKVVIDNKVYSAIGKGLLIFLGIHQEDQASCIDWMINKIINLRIFADDQQKMNLSLKDIAGEILIVSQFTLYGNCLTGRRPDFLEAARPEIAIPLYELFIEKMKKEIAGVKTGQFGAMMEIGLVNDGPVTILLENPK